MGIAFLHKDKYSIKKGKTTPPDFYIDPKYQVELKFLCKKTVKSKDKERNIFYSSKLRSKSFNFSIK